MFNDLGAQQNSELLQTITEIKKFDVTESE